MTDYVVDTDVVSYGYRNSPEFDFYDEHLRGQRAVISFMTYAELMYGAAWRGWGQRRWNELRQYVLSQHVVFNAPQDLCLVWASLISQAKSQGRVLHCADGWIAATAVYLDVPLLTHNRRDYEMISGLKLISNAPQ